MGQVPGPVLLSKQLMTCGIDAACGHPVAYITQTTLSVDDTKT